MSVPDGTIPSVMYRIEQLDWFLMLVTKECGKLSVSHLNKVSSTIVEHTIGDT